VFWEVGTEVLYIVEIDVSLEANLIEVFHISLGPAVNAQFEHKFHVALRFSHASPKMSTSEFPPDQYQPKSFRNFVVVHHNHYHHHHHKHKHQGLRPLTRSFSRVTTALANVSSVFRVVCSDMISKVFGLVAFFASVKTSSSVFIYLV
jgi:hypothetical protein